MVISATITNSVIGERLEHLISSQSLNLGGRRVTTDDVATIPFRPFLSSAALRESPNSVSVNSLMLYSNLFCLPLLLARFTVPCRIVFAMPEDLEMWPYHLSFYCSSEPVSCAAIEQDCTLGHIQIFNGSYDAGFGVVFPHSCP